MGCARFHPFAGLAVALLLLSLSGCITNNMTPADYNKAYQNQWGNFRGG